MSEEGGVWRTIGGRRVFIKDGEDLATAMKNSGKFENKEKQEEPKMSSADAIREYQNWGYGTLNEKLRKNEELNEKEKSIDEGLQEGFNIAEPLETDTVVYRDSGFAITADAFEKLDLYNEMKERLSYANKMAKDYETKDNKLRFFAEKTEDMEWLNNKLKDYEFQDNAYYSTTTSYDYVQGFSEGQGGQGEINEYGAKEILRINIPKGTKAIDMAKSGSSHEFYQNESEILLNKTGSLKITNVIYDYGTDALLISCDYIEKGDNNGNSKQKNR